MIFRDLGTFWKTLDKKKVFLGSKIALLVQELHYSIVYLAYCTELNLQICNYAEKWRIFALAERLPT